MKLQVREFQNQARTRSILSIAIYPLLALIMKPRFVIASFLVWMSIPLFSQTSGTIMPNADEVMATVAARDSQREMLGAGYSGSREYVFENQHLNKHAQMLVTVTCDPDGAKHFQVVSEAGWKSAHKHVLQKMLESESDSSQPDTRPKTRLVSENYVFQMVGLDSLDGRASYVIDVIPKRHDKYLFRGRIWVDAQDYAVARVEGEPAKSFSFWIRSVHFVQQYHKDGVFWFPATTSSVTQARVFGTTEVDIRYFDYAPLSAQAHSAPGPSIEQTKYVRH